MNSLKTKKDFLTWKIEYKDVQKRAIQSTPKEEINRLSSLPDGISSEDWQQLQAYCKSMKMPNRRIRELCLDPYGYTEPHQIQSSQLEEIYLRIEAATTLNVGDVAMVINCHYHHYRKGEWAKGKNTLKTGEIVNVHNYADYKHSEKSEGVFYSVAVGKEIHCYQPGQLRKVKQEKPKAVSTTSTTLDRFEAKQGGLFSA